MMQDCFLHYRQDNESSSINSTGKVYCVCDEYEEMERFLKAHPEKKGKMEGIKSRLKYDSYMWNFERLSASPLLQDEFILRASKEFNDDMQKGYIEPKYFPQYKWHTLTHIMMHPDQFARAKRAGRTELYELQDASPKASNAFIGAVRCLKDHGIGYTVQYGIRRIKGEE